MRELISVNCISQLELVCQFDDRTIKLVNLNQIAQSEAFQFLNDEHHVNNLVNKTYFIEWPNYEADLSADTLWHLGVETHLS